VALTCNVDADKLAEGRDNDEPTDVGNPREIADPLNERSDTDADTPEPTDKVGNDEDPPTKLLIETLDTLKVGATVEGTVSASEPEDSERSIDGKDVERLSESYDRTSVDGTVESAVI
jgi:hypothetical protein